MEAALKKAVAENLKREAEYHKRTCYTDDCDVSLFLLGLAYREFIDRELTKDEVRLFL